MIGDSIRGGPSMSIDYSLAVKLAASVLAVLAAGFWLWASLITVPDNVDTFISVLQRIGKLNAYGALSASFAAARGVLLIWLERSRWNARSAMARLDRLAYRWACCIPPGPRAGRGCKERSGEGNR